MKWMYWFVIPRMNPSNCNNKQAQLSNKSSKPVVIFSQLEQQLKNAQQQLNHIQQHVQQLAHSSEQNHHHLTEIEQGTNLAYQQMAAIDQATDQLLSGTKRTQQQLQPFSAA